MQEDVSCPYCGSWQDICKDDGRGYRDEEQLEEECEKCGKNFLVQVSVSFNYSSQEAPCKNGQPHEWRQIVGYPKEHFIGRFECTYCHEEDRREEEKRRAAMQSLYVKSTN